VSREPYFDEESEVKCHFGKHKGQDITDIPSGYLRWRVEKIDPVPLPKYRFHDDGKAMTVEEVRVLESKNRDFLSAAEDELLNRDPT